MIFPYLIGFAAVAGVCIIVRRIAANIIHFASLQDAHQWHD